MATRQITFVGPAGQLVIELGHAGFDPTAEPGKTYELELELAEALAASSTMWQLGKAEAQHAAPAAPAAPAAETPRTLADLTIAELDALAEAFDVGYDKGAKKADKIAALEAVGLTPYSTPEEVA